MKGDGSSGKEWGGESVGNSKEDKHMVESGVGKHNAKLNMQKGPRIDFGRQGERINGDK